MEKKLSTRYCRGTLVNILGMRRMNTRGIKQTNKCMLMTATCYNLKKLLNFKAPKILVKVKAMAHEAGSSVPY